MAMVTAPSADLFYENAGKICSRISEPIWGRIFSALPPCYACGINTWLQKLFTTDLFWHQQLEKDFSCSAEKEKTPIETYREKFAIANATSSFPFEIWLNIFSHVDPCHALCINHWLHEQFTSSAANILWKIPTEKYFPYSTLQAEIAYQTCRMNYEVFLNYRNKKHDMRSHVVDDSQEPLAVIGPVLTYPDKNCAYLKGELKNFSLNIWNPQNDEKSVFDLKTGSIESTRESSLLYKFSVEKFKEHTLFYFLFLKNSKPHQIAICEHTNVLGSIPVQTFFKPILINDRLYIAPSLKKLHAYDPLTGKELDEPPLLEIPENFHTHILTYGINRKAHLLHVLLSKQLPPDNMENFYSDHIFVQKNIRNSYFAHRIITFNLDTQEKVNKIKLPPYFPAFNHATISDNFLLVAYVDLIRKYKITEEKHLLYDWTHNYECNSFEWTILNPHVIVGGHYFFCVSTRTMCLFSIKTTNNFLEIRNIGSGNCLHQIPLLPSVQRIAVLEDCVCLYKYTADGSREIELRDFSGNLLPNSEEIK